MYWPNSKNFEYLEQKLSIIEQLQTFVIQISLISVVRLEATHFDG